MAENRRYRRERTPEGARRHYERRANTPPHNHFERRTPTPPHHYTSNAHRRVVGGFDRYGRISTPFTRRVLNARLPAGYRIPNIAPYNGLNNPENFLGQYQYNMLNQGLEDVHMCKLFPELLIDHARRWFDSLPPSSVDSYTELMRAFHRRFFQKTAPKFSSAHLLTVRQGRDESISDFLTRFNTESLKVEDANDQLIISAFQNGVLPGALYRKIVRTEPRTASELWRIADRFAMADEADRRKNEEDREDRG